MSIDGSVGKYGTTIDVSIPYLPMLPSIVMSFCLVIVAFNCVSINIMKTHYLLNLSCSLIILALTAILDSTFWDTILFSVGCLTKGFHHEMVTWPGKLVLAPCGPKG